jgi:hypothetical protein
MAILLGYRGEQHVPRALESGQLSGHCGLRIGLNGERPVAIDPKRTSATWAVALFVRHGNKRFSSHNLRICIARVQESADYSHKAVEGPTFVQATGLTSLKVGPLNAIILSNTRPVLLQRPASNRRFPP